MDDKLVYGILFIMFIAIISAMAIGDFEIRKEIGKEKEVQCQIEGIRANRTADEIQKICR